MEREGYALVLATTREYYSANTNSSLQAEAAAAQKPASDNASERAMHQPADAGRE